LTVSASIPIAVLSISILRAFGKSTVLENNIVQTTGSAGESIAGGVIFTLPALIFLGFPLEYWSVFFLSLIGGWLGVLMMIPLRRQLIVKEHGNLTYPEGTACADVLVAGDRGGSFAGKVFWGLGLGGLYALCMETFGLWPDTPAYDPKWLPGASLRANITPEYLGVGYIIGPRIAAFIFSGGVFSWLVLMPAIKFFGSLAPGHALYPSTVPIPAMNSDQLWASYIRPLGAGAVAASGVITLGRTVPTIWKALRDGLRDVRAREAEVQQVTSRTEHDLSMKIVVFGSLGVVAMMWALLTFRPIPGAQTTLGANLLAAVFVVVFGFLFVTVSSRICGLIGSSSNPISGMAIATLMATCAVFLVAGWTGGRYAVLALMIGGVVCIAAANAGGTSQDLKTGFLVGATPWKQQVALMIGVMASVIAVGGTLKLMNVGLAEYKPIEMAINIQQLPVGVQVESQSFTYNKKNYVLLNAIGSPVVPDGKYLYDAATRKIEVQWIQGIGSSKAAAPQARLMATVINGILEHRLPWRLVLLGVFLVFVVELLGIRSLPFAVGSYLPIAATATIFAGGVVSWLGGLGRKPATGAESEVNSGSLYASGLIAGGGIFGLFGIVVALLEDPEFHYHIFKPGTFTFGPRLAPVLSKSEGFAVLMFVILAATQFYFARKKMD
ncbi:MAG: oligopeptide transporter, OPT family, partial [Acidobacteriota bacterium]|nr:oligopeptide transporter, OPT family [Acidobacteriota bacterium]